MELSPEHITIFCSNFDPTEYLKCLKYLPSSKITKPKVKMRSAFIEAFNPCDFKEFLVKDIHKACIMYFWNENNDFPIVTDTGATLSLTSNIPDFVGNIQPC